MASEPSVSESENSLPKLSKEVGATDSIRGSALHQSSNVKHAEGYDTDEELRSISQHRADAAIHNVSSHDISEGVKVSANHASVTEISRTDNEAPSAEKLQSLEQNKASEPQMSVRERAPTPNPIIQGK